MSRSSSPAAGPMSSGGSASVDRFAGGAALDSAAGRLAAILQDLGAHVFEVWSNSKATPSWLILNNAHDT